jgi:transposase
MSVKLPLVALAREYGSTTIYNRFVHWARRGVWENLFRELAGQGQATDTQRDHGCSRHNESA